MENFPYPPGAGGVKWVSTDWLEEHLNAGLTIIDAQPDMHDYIDEHVPGAAYLSEKLFRAPLKGVPNQYVCPEVFESVVRNIGLKTDQPAIVYTSAGNFKVQGDGYEQYVVAYTLLRFGHNKVYILDGGLDKWKGEGKTLTKVFPEPIVSKFKAKVNSDHFLEYEDFKAVKDRKDVIHLDTRVSRHYEGEGPWIKLGHIPGAINLPWTDLMDENNRRLLKPMTEIRSAIDKKGIKPEKMVICSCGSGRSALLSFAVLKWYLCYPSVRLYEGSFTEWTCHPENPTVMGRSPR